MPPSEVWARLERAEGALKSAGWTYMEGATTWKPPVHARMGEALQRLLKEERERASFKACGKNALRFFEEHTEDDGGGSWLTISGHQATCLLARIHDGEKLLTEALGDIEFLEWSARVTKYLDRPKGERIT